MSDVESAQSPPSIDTDRRRRWGAEEKRQILEEAFAPGAVVIEVARRHNIRPQQIYQWRDAVLTERNAKVLGDIEAFVPVDVVPEPETEPLPALGGPEPMAWPSGVMEIVLRGGRKVRVDGKFDDAVLRRLIGVLES